MLMPVYLLFEMVPRLPHRHCLHPNHANAPTAPILWTAEGSRPAVYEILELTYWGWVMHICVPKLTIIGLDNGLSPGRRYYWNQCWNIANWTLRDKLQWNFIRNSEIFIQENVLENVVCEMASILSRPQCFKRNPVLTCLVDYKEWLYKDTDPWVKIIAFRYLAIGAYKCILKCNPTYANNNDWSALLLSFLTKCSKNKANITKLIIYN